MRLQILRGKIRDLDLDKLTIILREVPDHASDLSLSLEDDQFLETAREAHYHELDVTVAAKSDGGRTWTVVELAFLSANIEPESR
ncbi:MAG: hypothetical protein H0U74_10265 [Bradymonadaceae bacterium]|nr:hypothetical protein [Lujinxingiaceae bacterium]